MFKPMSVLCTLAFVILLLPMLATASDINRSVGNLSTKDEVLQKLYQEFNITPPSPNEIPSEFKSMNEANFVKEDTATLARFEKRMRMGMEKLQRTQQAQTTRDVRTISLAPMVKYILDPIFLSEQQSHNISGESSNSDVIIVGFPVHALPARIESSYHQP